MALSAGRSKYLDEAYEDKTLAESWPPQSAPWPASPAADGQALQEAFNTKTVADLGTSKHFT